MTYDMDAVTPSCPLCSTNDRVARDVVGGGGRDKHTRPCWLCCSCWTAFLGGQHEWEVNRVRRDMRTKCYENMAKTFADENAARGAPPVWATGELLARIERDLAQEVA